jgi:hypothetical protein
MCYLIHHLTFPQLAWSVVIVYALHYAEEGPRLVTWLNEHHRIKNVYYTQKKLNWENALMFSVTLLTVLLLNIYPASWLLKGLTLGWAIGLFGNTLFHAVPTIRNGFYSPGVVTASMLFPLMLLLLLEKSMRTGILTIPLLAFAIVIGLIGYLVLIIFTHKVIDRLESPKRSERKH